MLLVSSLEPETANSLFMTEPLQLLCHVDQFVDICGPHTVNKVLQIFFHIQWNVSNQTLHDKINKAQHVLVT